MLQHNYSFIHGNSIYFNVFESSTVSGSFLLNVSGQNHMRMAPSIAEPLKRKTGSESK